MKRIALAIFPILLISVNLRAQSDVDALRYSQSSVTGTARSIGMAGAFGALGGDMSSMSGNPAGLGIYRKTEFCFSPSVFSNKTNSTYFSNSDVEFKNNFNFGNVGMVFNFPVQRYDTLNGWNNFNFGIGYNRINNYTSKTAFIGINPNNSYIDHFLEDANAGAGTNFKNLDLYGADLAFSTFMINFNRNDSNHYTSVLPYGGATQMFKSITSGSTGEIPISFAGNYSDKLYLGATLGIPYINYQEDISFTETATTFTKKQNMADGNINVRNFPFKSYTLNKSLTTTGTGLNFKFGMIYRVKDWLRLGASLHTPTYYQMNDVSNAMMVSNFENDRQRSKTSPNNSFAYQINTPMKASGSLAFIIGKLGLISADVEYIDYSEMKMSSATDQFYDVNQLIQNTYTSTTNIKIGTEWRYKEFSFRGGIAHFGSPYKYAAQNSNWFFPGSGQGVDNSKTALSLGVGVREKDYFLDFGYVITGYKSYYIPYTVQYAAPVSTIANTSQNFVLTMGLKF